MRLYKQLSQQPRLSNVISSASAPTTTTLSTGGLKRAHPRPFSKHSHPNKNNQSRQFMFNYTNMIKTAIQRGQHAKAESIFNEMSEKGIPRDAVVYNIFIRAASNDPNRLMSLMSQMRNDRVLPTVRTYNTVMGVSSHQKCLELFQHMQDDGITPDSGTLNILIKSVGNDLMSVDRLFQQGVMVHGIQPNDYTYSGVFKALRNNIQQKKKQNRFVGPERDRTYQMTESYIHRLIDDVPNLTEKQFAFARDAASLIFGRQRCNEICEEHGKGHLSLVDAKGSFGETTQKLIIQQQQQQKQQQQRELLELPGQPHKHKSRRNGVKGVDVADLYHGDYKKRAATSSASLTRQQPLVQKEKAVRGYELADLKQLLERSDDHHPTIPYNKEKIQNIRPSDTKSQGLRERWKCFDCGWKNKGTNAVCGGGSAAHGCGKPKPTAISQPPMSQRQMEKQLVYYNKKLAQALKKGSNIGGANTPVKRMRRASKILDKMHKEGVRSNAVSYTTVMKGHMENILDRNFSGKSDAWKSIDALFVDMNNRRVVPDTYCFNTLLSGNAKVAERSAAHGDLSNNVSARTCYRKAQELWEKMNSPWISQRGITPDGHTYVAMIRTCIAAEEVGSAINLYRDMLEEGGHSLPNVEICRYLLSGYVGRRECERLLAEYEENVMRVIESYDVASVLDATTLFSSLCHGMCTSNSSHANGSERVVSICLNALRDDKHTLHDVLVAKNGEVCHNILRPLCEIGEVKHALSFHDAMLLHPNVSTNLNSYSLLLSSIARHMMDLSKAGRITTYSAEQSADAAVASSEGSSETQLQLLKEVRSWMGVAMSLFGDMKEQHWRWNSPSWMSSSNSQMDDVDDFDNSWRKYPAGLSRAYGAIMMACKASKDVITATQCFEEMLRDEDRALVAGENARIPHTQESMGWQTTRVDEKAVKNVLPLLMDTVGHDTYVKLCRKHETSLARLLTLETTEGRTTEQQVSQHYHSYRANIVMTQLCEYKYSDEIIYISHFFSFSIFFCLSVCVRLYGCVPLRLFFSSF